MVLVCTWSDMVLICMLLASFFSVYYTLSLTKKKKNTVRAINSTKKCSMTHE